MSQPQPDNYAYVMGRSAKKENCAAVHKNRFAAGAAVHDEVCSRKLPVVCEAAYMSTMDVAGDMSSAKNDMM